MGMISDVCSMTLDDGWLASMGICQVTSRHLETAYLSMCPTGSVDLVGILLLPVNTGR